MHEGLDYWSGKSNLREGVPWLVPGAVSMLEEVLDRKRDVLEFGSGGSTVFFARRSGRVTSYETRPKWCDLVRKRLNEEKLENVDLRLFSNEEILEQLRTDETDLRSDVILVDSVPVSYRCKLLVESVKHLRVGGYVVVDNYGIVRLELGDVPALLGLAKLWVFDDEHWSGRGTAMLKKEGGL